MNMETVKKCAELAAQQFKNAFGVVPEDIQTLLDELNAPPADEPAEQPKSRKAK